MPSPWDFALNPVGFFLTHAPEIKKQTRKGDHGSIKRMEGKVHKTGIGHKVIMR